MAMNKQEQEFYKRAIETGKKYETLYGNIHNQLEDFKSYLSVRKTMLEINDDKSIKKDTEISLCKDLLCYLKTLDK